MDHVAFPVSAFLLSSAICTLDLSSGLLMHCTIGPLFVIFPRHFPSSLQEVRLVAQATAFKWGTTRANADGSTMLIQDRIGRPLQTFYILSVRAAELDVGGGLRRNDSLRLQRAFPAARAELCSTAYWHFA